MDTITTLQTLFEQACLVNPDPEALPGISRDEIESALQEIGLVAPEPLVELYQWHNGIWNLNGVVSFLPLDEAVADYCCYHNLKQEFVDIGWEPSWFPILDINAEVQICLDVNTGKVLATNMESEHYLEVTAYYGNLIHAIRELFEIGAYTYSDSIGAIEADPAVWKTLCHQHLIRAIPGDRSRPGMTNPKVVASV